VIRNNLLYDNHASGVSLYRIDGAAGATNNLVINNTIVSAADGRWCINISDGSTGNVVRNNILYSFHSFRGVITIDDASRPGFVSDHNSLMNRLSLDGGNSVVGLAAWQAAGYDADSFLAAPADHFLAPGSDFHLLASSPAVDVGVATGAPPVDLDGAARPVGAGWDLGAYERQLLECGDGGIDPGEQCGEPGLACGNGGQVCSGCQCIDAPACGSGIGFATARQTARANPAKVSLRVDAVLPTPLVAVDPLLHGVRVVIDATSGGGGIDVTVPPGAFDGLRGWRVNAAGTKWSFTDRTGSLRLTRAVVRNLSARTPGRVALAAKGKGAPIVLPSATAVRTQVVFGAAGECASRVWNAPAEPRPRCGGGARRLSCR
jgi:hypothetical protein